MKKKPVKRILLVLTTFLLCLLWTMPVFAGSRTLVSDFSNGKDGINLTEWNVTDDNICYKDGKLIMPAVSSTEETKFISKLVAGSNELVDEFISMSSPLRLTELPQGKQFILAFGLANIEAYSGEDGNVEIVFTNEGDICVSIIAYVDGEAQTIVEKTKCGISLKSNCNVDASISSDGNMSVKVNGKNICNKKIPVSGTGRFGVLQTGECGVEFSKLKVTCNSYDTPENTNIEENFDSGEFNANLLSSFMEAGNGVYPAYAEIREYNGNNVFMFCNAGLGYLGTRHEYSNFEISFDIPYIQHKDLLDDAGNLIVNANNSVCIGFGETSEKPTGYAFTSNPDLIRLTGYRAHSYLRKDFDVSIEEMGLCNYDANEGYSVKFTVVDGKGTLQLKALNSNKYVTIATAEYAGYTKGYVRIWSSGDSSFAIDNLKITNLDQNAQLIDVEYQTSKMVVEDYELTEADTEMVFKEDATQTAEENTINPIKIAFFISIGCAVVLIIIGAVVGHSLKRRTCKGGKQDEKI